MPKRNDETIYRTFEEFEREELRRADAMGGSVDTYFDGMFTEELDFDATSVRLSLSEDADDEE